MRDGRPMTSSRAWLEPSGAPPPALWRDAEFVKRWSGQTISAVGSQITRVALPLTAVLLLDATPAQMGLLQAVQALPHLVLGLLAGVWVDRLPRRPVMIGADLGRAALLACVPTAAALGALRIEHLYAILVVTATLDLFFDLAATSFLPSFVRLYAVSILARSATYYGE